MSSFGRPPSSLSAAMNPPERGSFPLDHDKECKEFMTQYMTCLKSSKGKSEPCRLYSKLYLNCRMGTGLMEPDDWENLGLQDVDLPKGVKDNSAPPS